MSLYQNKYRIESCRLKGYDYAQDGMYFVTICTKNRELFFGKAIGEYHKEFIENAEVKLSEIGNMARKYWQEIPKHFPFVNLEEFVIMPNHVHGILNFEKRENIESDNEYKNKFGSQSKNLSSVIRGFKIGVTKYSRQNKIIQTVWQPRFHDRIIRNKDELNKISDYILFNQQNWKNDEYLKM